MIKLNSLGQRLGKEDWVHAVTDVTGFGLLGHLIEMCEASKTSAVIDLKKIPQIAEAQYYLEQGAIPGGTGRNWHSYGAKVSPELEPFKNLLADPQTSGGLLLAIDEARRADLLDILARAQINHQCFGEMQSTGAGEFTIYSA